MEDRLPRKLAVILSADVASYSRLSGEDEDATTEPLVNTWTSSAHRSKDMKARPFSGA